MRLCMYCMGDMHGDMHEGMYWGMYGGMYEGMGGYGLHGRMCEEYVNGCMFVWLYGCLPWRVQYAHIGQ